MERRHDEITNSKEEEGRGVEEGEEEIKEEEEEGVVA